MQQTHSCIPVVPAGFVPRPRLDDVVEDGVRRGTVTVSAPAGAGKTLMLSSWAARRAGRTAWLSLEREDADPARFWGHVLTALQGAGAVPPSSALATMTAPPTFDRRFVTGLLTACEALSGTTALVLDDGHELVGTPALRSLADALRRGTGSLRPVLSTRADLPLPLQRLRLAGQLTELRTADLGLDDTEAVSLLERQGIQLSPGQLETLMDRTEGWAAGLRLAALSLQGRGDLDVAVGELAGDLRAVADYFVEEILARQPPDVTAFLLDICIAKRVTADLADTLTGRIDGQRVLEQLERDNLFVVALDERRGWYRFHHLFADVLRQRLSVEDPQRRRRLHQRAATWFADHGDPLESARHLAAARCWRRLAHLVLRDAGAEVLGVERLAVAELLRAIPAQESTVDPEVAASAAVRCYIEDDAAGVLANVARARNLLSSLGARDAEVTEAVLSTFEALAAGLDDDAERQIVTGDRALLLLGMVSSVELPALEAYRSAATIVLARGTLWAGRLDEAQALLERAASALAAPAARTPVLSVQVHANLALLKALRGHLRGAAQEADLAMGVAERSGWLFLPQSATAFLARAVVHLGRAEPAQCSVAVERGRSCVGGLPDRFTATALALVRARLDLATGKVTAARAALAALRRQAAGWTMPRFLDTWCSVVEAEARLAAGDTVMVRLAMQPTHPAQRSHQRPEAQRAVLSARACLADNRVQECLDTLLPWRLEAPPDLVPAAEVWLLVALAQDRLRHDAEAQAALARALDIAAPEGIARPFLLCGPRVGVLLEYYQQNQRGHRLFVALLLEKLHRGQGPGAVPALHEPLTDRERSVLMLLPTMMSNTEIADELFVSVNTVKVHLKSLYRKLGVSNRRQAAAWARDLDAAGSPDTPALV